MRKYWLLAAGILLFGVLSIGVVLLATSDSSPPGSFATGPGASAPNPAARLGPLGTIPPDGPATQQPPAPPQQYDPPPPRPPEGSWEAVPPVARASALGSLGGVIGRGLNELKDKVAVCFDEDVQARHGLTRFTQTQDYAPLPDHGTTILMLHVETFAGGALIVDAPLETRGNASDGLVACAQRVLRGRKFEAPEATGGERHRLLYPLLQ